MWYGNCLNPVSPFSDLTASIDPSKIFSSLVFEEDPEMENEEVFRSAGQLSLFEDVCAPLQGIDTCSRHNHATISPPAEVGEHIALEEDEGDEEAESASSTGFVVATLWSSAVYLLNSRPAQESIAGTSISDNTSEPGG